MVKKCLIALLALGFFQSSISQASFEEERRKALNKIRYGGAVAAAAATVVVSAYL